MSSSTPTCDVSVIIPTRNRPHMVLAAVRSVLEQTRPPKEVIVVIDGLEEGNADTEHLDTEEVLSKLDHPCLATTCLRVIAFPVSIGGGGARNKGVHAATGEWIAFLDDDDLWLPGKLEAQLSFLDRLSPGSKPVLSCPVLARAPHWEEVWPHEPYRSGQSIAEYLFCRRGWRYGAALLQTSTLLAPRELLLRIPFDAGLRKHQDWDWLLRIAADPVISVHSVGRTPLAIFHVEGDRSSVGRTKNWRFSLEWALARRQLFTPRAFVGFLTTECAAQAQRESWGERMALLAVLFHYGLPSAADFVRLVAFLFMPQGTRRFLRDCFRRHGSRAAQLSRRVPAPGNS